MIYVKMNTPDVIILHYHGEDGGSCKDFVIDPDEGSNGGTVIQGIDERDFAAFAREWRGKFTVIPEAEVDAMEASLAMYHMKTGEGVH